MKQNKTKMINKIIAEYEQITDNLNDIIKGTGYKINYIIAQLGMSRTTFYHKRKNGLFTLQEIKEIIRIIEAEKKRITIPKKKKGAL